MEKRDNGNLYKGGKKDGPVTRGLDFPQKLIHFSTKLHKVSMAGAMRGQHLLSSPHPVRRHSACV